MELKIRTRNRLRLRMKLEYVTPIIGIFLSLIILYFISGTIIISVKTNAYSNFLNTGSSKKLLPVQPFGADTEAINSSHDANDPSEFYRLGYVDMTNTGIMYISLGTIVASEGSVIISASGNTENNGNFYVKGDWTNNGTYTPDTGKVIFWDVDAQVINGSVNTVFYNVDVDKSPGTVSLDINTTVSNKLTLINGTLDLNAKTLTISNPATSGIAYTNGYIKSERTDNLSKLQWNIGSTTGAHIIPFGTAAGIIIPFTLNLTAGTIGNVTTSTYPTPANNLPYPLTPDSVSQLNDVLGNNNSANTVDRFWQINKTGGSGTLTITFTYATGEEPANGEANLVAQRFNSGNYGWDAPVPSQTANTASNTVTAPDVTLFGPFTLAKSNAILPIELLIFTAKQNDRKLVDLEWVTASEINNSFFTIQRSKDIINIEDIEDIPGAGTSTQPKYYTTVDKNPYPGGSFYRLKQTDYDGISTLFDWQYVHVSDRIEKEELSINHVYPNPFSDEFTIEFSVRNESEVTMQLLNDIGQVVFSDKVRASEGKNSYTYSNRQGLSAGIYYFNVVNNGLVKSLKLVKKN